MKYIIHTALIGLFAIGCSTTAGFAQNKSAMNETMYQIGLFGSAATGDNTPFWITSNQYGKVPLNSNNTFLETALFHQQSFKNGISWNAGLDVIYIAPRYRNVYIHQLYAGIKFKCLQLTVGSKEETSAFELDNNLSSGDVILSNNARPIPGVRLSIPEFTVVPATKGWLQVKGNFSVGRSFDNAYLQDFINTEQTYVKDILWHYKSIHFRIKDTKNDAPLFGVIGLQHIAQWGGTSTNPKIGKQPSSFKDFIRVVCGRSGGEQATASDQINVLGSHHISYDLRLGYTLNDWQVEAYHQHLCYDKSGLELYNGMDGLWGIQLSFPKKIQWINRLVVEHFSTMNSSGPFHYIWFDHDKYPGRGGGGDNYYNNDEYISGNSYFNKSTGSPLIPSPEYNEDHKLGFKDNRIRTWHIGLDGAFNSQISYRFLATVMQGWGTAYEPFLKKKKGASLLIDINYTHPKLEGWQFKGSISSDTGTILGKESVGFAVSVSKTGLLKRWQ